MTQNTENATALKTYDAPQSVIEVELYSDEVTCMGGANPDQYEVWIRYVPYDKIICTKSLKEWFVAQRQKVYSAERFAHVIAETISATVPGQIKVHVRQKARGGISIDATAVASREHD